MVKIKKHLEGFILTQHRTSKIIGSDYGYFALLCEILGIYCTRFNTQTSTKIIDQTLIDRVAKKRIKWGTCNE